MARPTPFESARSFVASGGMPFTMGTIAVAAAAFVAWWLTKFSAAWYPLAFTSEQWWTRPWSIATYAILEVDFIRIVFACLMAFFFMGSLERAWPNSRFIPAYILLVLLPPLALWIGHLVTGSPQALFGLSFTTGCWTAAFGAYRPQAVILIFGIVPVKALWIGIFAALAIVFCYGQGQPLVGVCAGLAPLVAWLLGSKSISLSILEGKPKSFRDEFGKSLKTKRDAEEERRRLRELLERSVHDEDAD